MGRNFGILAYKPGLTLLTGVPPRALRSCPGQMLWCTQQVRSVNMLARPYAHSDFPQAQTSPSSL